LKRKNQAHKGLAVRIVNVLLESRRGDGSFLALKPKDITLRVSAGFKYIGEDSDITGNSVRGRIHRLYSRDRILNKSRSGGYYISDEDKARQFIIASNDASPLVRCGAEEDFPEGKGWVSYFLLEHSYRWYSVDEIWKGLSQLYPALTRKTVSQWLYRSKEMVSAKTSGKVKLFRRKGDEVSASLMSDLSSPIKMWVEKHQYEQSLHPEEEGEVCGEERLGIQLFESEVPTTDYLDSTNAPTHPQKPQRKGRVQRYRKDETPQVRISKYRSIYPLVGGCHKELIELLFLDPDSKKPLGHPMGGWFQFERRIMWRDGVIFDLVLTPKTFQLLMLPMHSYMPVELFDEMEQYRDEYMQVLTRDFGRVFCGHGRVLWKEFEFEFWDYMAKGYISAGFKSDSKAMFRENYKLWKYGDRSRERYSPSGEPDVGASTPEGIESERRKAKVKAKVLDEMFDEEYNKLNYDLIRDVDDRVDEMEKGHREMLRMQKVQMEWMKNETLLKNSELGVGQPSVPKKEEEVSKWDMGYFQ